MHNSMGKLALLSLTGVLALGLLALVWAMGQGSSEAQDDTMHNCPHPGKWAIAVWDGADGTDAEQAFDTCGEGAVIAAYDLDPGTQGWSRWFAKRPEISNLTTLDQMQGIIALAEAPQYEVTVQFNTSVTQDDIDEAAALLRAYDEDLEFLIMEIWPPIGRALLTTNVPDFCQTVETELEAKSYVDDVSCGPA
ncbi:MAG: hypothetical protein JSU97_05860 [Dehalococcoidia bacterium]|nr:MAG: hypothetical protein JSU97_05860 [Dehalococcoidia bacterium]